MADKAGNVIELIKELEEARAEYQNAEQAMSRARSNECAAINRINAAQKAIDDWYAKQKDSAKWNTHWHSERRKSQGASS